jgi:hypothetical protein
LVPPAIAALAKQLIFRASRQGFPSSIFSRFKGAENTQGWQITQRMTALQTTDIVKENQASAPVTMVGLHSIKGSIGGISPPMPVKFRDRPVAG